MKKHVYTIIGILIPLGPIGLSFDEKIAFYQYFWPVVIAAVSIGFIYIIWDIFAVKRDHWQFNADLVGETRIFHLPVGEWLFFMGVPYSVLFLWEVGRGYFENQIFLSDQIWVFVPLAILAIVIAIVKRKQEYTSWVSLSIAVTFLLMSLPDMPKIFSVHGLFFWGMGLFVFLIVNGIYVNLPTIYYSKDHFSGIRILGIPMEDFFYNTSYIFLLLIVHELVKKGLLS